MKTLSAVIVALLSSASFAAAQVAALSTSPTATPAPPSIVVPEVTRIVVSGGAIEQSSTDTAQAVSVLNEDQLKQNVTVSLGDTLATQPGVAASGFSPGASRPIIRGLSDNRVRVLNDGTEVFDVSNLSPDHAPSVSPLLSQSIEIVRGPATILFGSGAIGGVVNIVDNRIPVELPPETYSGEFDVRFASGDLERSGAGQLDVALSKHFVLHLDDSYQRTDSRRIPGHALDDRIRAELPPDLRGVDEFGADPAGEVANTYVKTNDWGIGGSYVWDKGYFGVSFNQFLSVYGIPDDPEVDEPGEPAPRVRLDVTKRQENVRSSVVDPFAGFETLNFKFVYTDYKHLEIENEEVGSTFKTSGVDSRFELVHQPLGLFHGSIGGQFFYKDLSILGKDAFLQPTTSVAGAAFLFEEVKLGALTLQFGGRVEADHVSIESSDPTLTSLTSPDQKEADFVPLSASGGVVYHFLDNWELAVNATFSQRAPTAEELFARGGHDATFQFIVGDPNLRVETSRGVDVSLRKKAGIVTGSISGYYNSFSDFIDFAPTADFIDGLQVFDYTPKDADFFGGEAQVDVHLLPLTLTRIADSTADDPKSVKEVITHAESSSEPNPHDLYLRLQADYVHAEESDTGEPLPRITPFRYSASLNYESATWSASIEGQRVSRQYRTAEFETSTPGYTFLNATLSRRLRIGPAYMDAYIRGTNLTNEEARDHLSFLKEVLPLEGRSIIVGIRTTF